MDSFGRDPLVMVMLDCGNPVEVCPHRATLPTAYCNHCNDYRPIMPGAPIDVTRLTVLGMDKPFVMRRPTHGLEVPGPRNCAADPPPPTRARGTSPAR